MRRQCSTHECTGKFVGQLLLLLKIHPLRSLLIHYNNSYPKLSAYNVPDPALSTLYVWFLISALWFKNKDLWSSNSKALADFWPCGLNHSTLRVWTLHLAGNPVLASLDSKHINLKCSLDSHPRSRQLSVHSVVWLGWQVNLSPLILGSLWGRNQRIWKEVWRFRKAAAKMMIKGYGPRVI